ncbi:MAG: DNA polymerase III subunit gamma/tau [Spirochaetia bacterium]|nr:DNA polymerase III subunit gamma/tau [Spirochaetia bacterium]
MRSLALKYRPKTFDDLIGQIHASQSLKNALEHNHIRQAYLFFGSRGVGKTSTARILAKCLNCEKGTSSKPCGACNNCVEIAEGRNMDVIEMDAASNRGIEHIRDLRESARFSPMKSKYKVYIIDEVHMLTNESFNALLKILEEPPPHVVFIMATTEQHKVPETILSRCQSFAFKKFSNNDIKERLEYILETEKVPYHKEALLPISQKAEGSMRDAISLLDQIIAYSGSQPIEAQTVLNLMGILPVQTHIEFLESFKSSNIKQTLLILHNLYNEGQNLKRFLWDFLNFIKNALLINKGIDDTESFTSSEIETMKKSVSVWDASELVLVFESLYKIYSNWNLFQTSKSSEIKVSLEIAVVDLFENLNKPSVSRLMRKIALLKNAIEKGATFEDNDIEPDKTEKMNELPDEKGVSAQANESIDMGIYIQKEFLAQEEENERNSNIFKNENS